MFKIIWVLCLGEFLEHPNLISSVNHYWKGFGIRVTPRFDRKSKAFSNEGGWEGERVKVTKDLCIIEQILENDPPQPECGHIVIKVPAHEPLVDAKGPLAVVDERERDINGIEQGTKRKFDEIEDRDSRLPMLFRSRSSEYQDLAVALEMYLEISMFTVTLLNHKYFHSPF
ncbi:hypothetical protein BGX38DRAFT_1140824 [Terfezia claveryi]|nr:hypothetical protein BGX38DRAFT_1140824 [Terfezia claveryi]